MARPPFAPYAVVDSLAAHPWIPSGEPRARSLEKRWPTQMEFSRRTGSRDLAIGQCAIYRIRYIIAGDLADALGRLRLISSAIQPSRERVVLVYSGPIGYRGDLRPPDTPNDSQDGSETTDSYGLHRFTAPA